MSEVIFQVSRVGVSAPSMSALICCRTGDWTAALLPGTGLSLAAPQFQRQRQGVPPSAGAQRWYSAFCVLTPQKFQFKGAATQCKSTTGDTVTRATPVPDVGLPAARPPRATWQGLRQEPALGHCHKLLFVQMSHCHLLRGKDTGCSQILVAAFRT